MPVNSDTASPAADRASSQIGVVVIGRNEGARLIACLASIKAQNERIVYVDSGSTDASIAVAKDHGAEIVALDMTQSFTAARARNAGFERLVASAPIDFVQFVDGDCTLEAGWLATASAHLQAHHRCAINFGTIRERFPEKTFFNRMIEREWQGTPGEVEWCGGIAMVRASSFRAASGFHELLIAGEEPELCVRLREAGQIITRLDVPMATHDADMRNLGEWLKRARRAGHAFAEVANLHRNSDQRIWAREALRPFFWTALLVAIVLAGVFAHPIFLGFIALYPLQVWRMAARQGALTRDGLAHGALLMLQKPWEAAGVIQFWFNRLTGRSARLIEYRTNRNGSAPS